MELKEYLECSEIVDFDHRDVAAKAREINNRSESKLEVSRNTFLFVRDEIRHTGDYKDSCRTTLKASEVLHEKSGWCYSKSILLAALLRANGVPTGFAYQRLSCSEYTDGVYCLHGLNWIYLDEFGWYRVDARGNKEGVNAQFTPPKEQLAFLTKEHEFDLKENFSKPIEEIISALKNNDTYEKMINNFPDLKE